jgi:endonuclease YncB( thermonuclease family)
MPRFLIWMVLGAALVIALVLQVQSGLFSGLTQPGCSTVLCCEDCRSISVSRIIDGDTFDSPAGRVRLFGVDTPERGERCYRQATERLDELAGNTVRVEPGPRAQDRSGRLLFYVYTGNGESIDEKLVREGLAHAWTEDGQHRDFLVDREGEAQQDNKGCLWQ